MEDTHKEESGTPQGNGVDIRSVIRDAVSEFIRFEQAKAEPAYKAELAEERRKREGLEKTVRDLIEENRQSRQAADELERSSTIRSELQRLGVTKVDLAYKAVKDDIRRTEEGRLVAATDEGEVGAKEYLARFVQENPELLPARVAGGSGATPAAKAPAGSGSVDLDKIRPGMSAEELARVREEVARVATQTMRGL
jgi:hypothetical protein